MSKTKKNPFTSIAEKCTENIVDRYPLTPFQEGVLYERLSGSAEYLNTLRFSWVLSGNLDLRAFDLAWQKTIDRHDILRTAFRWKGLKNPEQVVFSKVIYPITHFDWRAISENSRTHKLEHFLYESKFKTFDIQNAPLLHVVLIQMKDSVWEMVLTIHHLIIDGASLTAILEDFKLNYSALQRGCATILPSIQPYKKFVSWAEQHDFSASSIFWRDTLKGFQTPTALPWGTSSQNSSNIRPTRASEVRSLSAIETQDLNKFSNSNGTSVNRIAQAVWSILLSHYCGEPEVIFGLLVSGYPNDLKKEGLIIGPCLNTVPLRVRVDSTMTILSMLRKLDEDLKKIKNGPIHCPLKIIKKISDFSADQPLFRSILNLHLRQMIVRQSTSLGNSISMESTRFKFEIGNAWTTYPLVVHVIHDQELWVRLDYDNSVFAKTDASRIADHFITLLKSAIRRSGALISDLEYLRNDERLQLIEDWNRTEVFYPDRNRCLHEFIESQVEKSPDATALIFGNQLMSYDELNRRANKLAHFLRKQGVGPNTLVGVCAYRSFELVISLFGILKAGGAYVPIDPLTPSDRVEVMLDDCNPKLVLVHAVAPELISNKWKTFNLSDWDMIDAESGDNLENHNSAKDLVYGIYTSGSTGKPKCALNHHRGVVNWLLWLQDEYKMAATERVLLKTPFTFDVSVGELFWTLSAGALLVIAAPGGHKDPTYLMDVIREHGITTINFVPSMLAVFLDHPEIKECTSLKRVILIGEAVSFELQQRFFSNFNAELLNLYGPTEAAVTVTAWTCQKQSSNKIVPIGKPIPNVRIYILDRHLHPVPIGVTGELYIGGIAVGYGYLNRKELTEQKFIKDPFSQDPSARLYATGDLARYMSDGNIECLGRTDFQVKIRGNRIELGEIEALLLKFPGVREAVVHVFENNGDKSLVAYLAPTKDSTVIAETVGHFLQRSLPDYMVPSHIIVLESMPLNKSGKLDRKALPSPKLSNPNSTLSSLPTTPMTRSLAKIWGKVLNLETVGLHDNYFSIGGNSLKAMQISMIAKKEGINLSPMDMFESQTIDSLEEKLKIVRISPEKNVKSRMMTLEALKSHAVLSPEIAPKSHSRENRKSNRFLLTGATGFLGAHLLKDLLQATDAEILCLIRSQSDDQGLTRIIQQMKVYSLDDRKVNSRVKIVRGDISKPLFGLEKSKFLDLSKSIDSIYHLGAWVNHAYPFAMLKHSNVGGTHEVLRLACEGREKVVHFFSSISVGVESEDGVLDTSSPFPIPYVQTKWVAEKLAWTALSRGVPVVIYRPGLMTWNSATGIGNRSQFECLMLGSCVKMRQIPDDETLSKLLPRFTPVDFASSAIVDLSLKQSSIGKAFHILNPDKVSWNSMVRKMSAHGLKIEQVPYAQWETNLAHQAKTTSNPLLEGTLELLHERFGIQSRYSCRKTLEALAGTGISCPNIELSFGRFLEFLNSPG